jgi:hypothetical protein
MCLRFVDPGDGVSKYFCGPGGLGDGVVGNVTVPSNSGGVSPRSFFLKTLAFGQNTWTRHWEWKNVLQVISVRDPLPNGFALDNAWNLNPNDFHADGASKGATYVAAVALKTNTDRSGVRISPYHTRNVQKENGKNPTGTLDSLALAQQNPGELNQGEIERSNCTGANYPSPGCTEYFTWVDTLSQGNAGNCNDPTCAGDLVGMIDTKVSQGYLDMANSDPVICSWGNDWQISAATLTSTGGTGNIKLKNWAANALGTVAKNLRVPTTDVPYALAINRAEGQVQRCPSWNLCGTTLHNAVLIAYDANWNKMYGVVNAPWGVGTSATTPQRSTLRFGGWLPNTTSQNICYTYYNHECPFDTHGHCAAGFATSSPCEQFYCGMTIPAVTFDKSQVDWYVCGAGAACQDYNQSDSGIWSLACSGSYECTIPMGGDDTYVVALPPALRGGPNSNLTWAAINGK